MKITKLIIFFNIKKYYIHLFQQIYLVPEYSKKFETISVKWLKLLGGCETEPLFHIKLTIFNQQKKELLKKLTASKTCFSLVNYIIFITNVYLTYWVLLNKWREI